MMSWQTKCESHRGMTYSSTKVFGRRRCWRRRDQRRVRRECCLGKMELLIDHLRKVPAKRTQQKPSYPCGPPEGFEFVCRPPQKEVLPRGHSRSHVILAVLLWGSNLTIKKICSRQNNTPISGGVFQEAAAGRIVGGEMFKAQPVSFPQFVGG